jgi:predicted ATPase
VSLFVSGVAMKLLKLSYHDRENEWGFEDLSFFHDLTLLVGASGVGKTRILRAVRQLRNIANDASNKSFWGIEWNCEFFDKENKSYCWAGTYERRGLAQFDGIDEDDKVLSEVDGLEQNQPKMLRERLLCDGREVFTREGNTFKLRGTTQITAKLSPHKSGFALLSEEDDIEQARTAISQILFVDTNEDRSDERRLYTHYQNYAQLSRRNWDLEKIQSSGLNTHIKLSLVFDHAKKKFTEIVEAFCEVFPSIEEVIISRQSSNFFQDQPVILLKEKGVPSRFKEYDLSSGMRRTLMHLARLALWPDGTLILVDEFENSLGSNCIDAVAQQLLGSRRRLQFIITSHHPYIINAIPINRWKVIARDKGIIKNFTPEQLGLDDSTKHESFLQLINTDVFKFGTLPHESLLHS